MEPQVPKRSFTFPVFLGACLLLAAFGNASYSNLPAGKILLEGDTWWHLAAGEQIIATHSWPTADLYSFTVHGNPWIAYEWLGEVLMALAMQLGGLRGLAILLVAFAALFTLLLYYYAWLCSGNVKAAAVACLAVLPLAGAFFSLRPQLLAYCLFLITLICAEHFRRGKSAALWVLPGVFVLWVNLHGSFTVGLFVLGLYWVCGLRGFRLGSVVGEPWTAPQRRHLLLTILLCVLALLVTPYGTRLAAYPFELATQQQAVLKFTVDWQPMDFSSSYGLWFLAFLLAAWLWQVFFPLVYRAEVMAFFVFTVLESCLHRRFFIFFAMAFAPLLARVLAQWLQSGEDQKGHPIVDAVLVLVILSIVVALLPSQSKLQSAVAEAYPAGAVQYLRRHPVPSGLFNEDSWGGFLIWSLGPQHRVFIDGREDIYDYGGVLPDYVHITTLQDNPLLLLRKYGVKACLLHRDAPLVALLAASPGWERVYEDRISAIFVFEGIKGSGSVQSNPSAGPLSR